MVSALLLSIAVAASRVLADDPGPEFEDLVPAYEGDFDYLGPVDRAVIDDGIGLEGAIALGGLLQGAVPPVPPLPSVVPDNNNPGVIDAPGKAAPLPNLDLSEVAHSPGGLLGAPDNHLGDNAVLGAPGKSNPLPDLGLSDAVKAPGGLIDVPDSHVGDKTVLDTPGKGALLPDLDLSAVAHAPGGLVDVPAHQRRQDKVYVAHPLHGRAVIDDDTAIAATPSALAPDSGDEDPDTGTATSHATLVEQGESPTSVPASDLESGSSTDVPSASDSPTPIISDGQSAESASGSEVTQVGVGKNGEFPGGTQSSAASAAPSPGVTSAAASGNAASVASTSPPSSADPTVDPNAPSSSVAVKGTPTATSSGTRGETFSSNRPSAFGTTRPASANNSTNTHSGARTTGYSFALVVSAALAASVL